MAIEKRGARCAAALVLLVVCASARAASAISDGPLQNGNFEYGPSQHQMEGSVVKEEHAIPFWKIKGFVEYIVSGQKQGDMILTVPEGAHAVRLGNEACILQEIGGLTRGEFYSLTFSASRTCAQTEKLNVTVAPPYGGQPAQSGELPIQTVYTSSGWDSYSYAFKAEQGVATVIIHNPGQEEDPACGPIIDAVAIKKLGPPQATAPNNLLKNGDFEEGPYIEPSSSWGVLVPPMDEDDVSPLPGWKVMSYSKVVKYIDSAHFAVPHGGHCVELVSGVETALLQEVPGTSPGATYRLEFSVGDAGNGCAATMQVEAYAAQGRTAVAYNSQGTGGSTRASLEFTATETNTRVVFVSSGYHMKSDGTMCGPVVDDVSLVCVSQQPHGRRLLL